jgi:pimeloyl-ACP methyl ester carboxylesterase
MDHTLWMHQEAALRSQFRILCPDLRGQGLSPTPAGIYDVDDLANDVLETLAASDVTPPFRLGGLSMGGYVAFSIALRFPEKLAGLILVNTRAAGDSPDLARTREASASAIETTGDVAPVLAAMLPRLVAPATSQSRPDVIQHLERMARRITPAGLAATLRGLARRPDRTPDLSLIGTPTLVIAGEDDAVVPLTEARAMHASLPNASLVVIPGAGHVAPLEQPQAVNQAIADFLARLESP